MAGYYVAYEADLRSYPNYSFEVGDITGDGRLEMVALNQNGNRLRVVDLGGSVVMERRIINHGNWGTPIPALLDVDADGRAEVVVPSLGPRFEARIVAMNAEGEVVAERAFGTYAKDDYGIGVPLLKRFGHQCGESGLVAGLAGGWVSALDARLNEVWRVGGFRNDFGHEFYVADVDGDGLDEVAFCTCDHINGGYAEDGWNSGELVLLDHDGRLLLRVPVPDYCADTHFDDVAMADFCGRGDVQILLEKGFLIDLQGRVIWDVSHDFDHGQWVAHWPNPDGRGRLAFISELWGAAGKSALFDPQGHKMVTIEDLPRTVLDPDRFPGWAVLPTRCHMVQWAPGQNPEIFVGEQVRNPTSHDCFSTFRLRLKAFFLNLRGELVGELPFDDAQVEGYWYNGEVPSRVADVDGDGRQEVAFPRQDGRVMVIKKREGA